MFELINKLIRSTMYGLRGLWYGFYTRKNMITTLIVLFIYIFVMWYFDVDVIRAVIILFSCLMIIVAEVINTAIEKVIDVLYPKYNRGLGMAKDISAGAVVVASITAAVVSAILLWEPFTSKIAEVFNKGIM
ncbi:MAG TPA: diacylglycerol kinase family protein [Candidatus Goldiibacteriota bacterium]|jgi:diacylglycerol kinase (ATP)|nr:diacylglycerol kinase family protein [Candidatus Goldiibacteriota bacterium]HRQ43593.1 diacylglycerol kinase family protein [Candidatus Goldiibacteriota bacterium]